MSPLIALLALTTAVASSCPSPCTCSNEVIVCKCAGSEVILRAFAPLEYFSKVYVHSCDKLIIEPFTFKGLAVLDEISIFDVKELVIRPNAFNLMKKYPTQFIVKDVKIVELPTEAFAGIRNMTYLRIQNSKIGAIRSGALSKMRHIDYVYFWEVEIGDIEPRAFSEMTNVQNFFLREKISIGNVGHSLFSQSLVRNIFVRDAVVNSLHPSAFTGMKGGKELSIANLSVRKSMKNWIPGTVASPQELTEVDLRNCTLQQFCLGAFSNAQSIKIIGSSIKNIIRFVAPARNITSVWFENTKIEDIRDRALSDVEFVKDIGFKKCDIATVHHKSFLGIDVFSLRFEDCKVSQIHSHAFANSTIRNLAIENSQIDVLNQNAFEHLHATRVEIERSQFDTVRTEVFRKIVVKDLIIYGSSFRRIYSWTFVSALVGRATIFKNRFEHPDIKTFEGLGTENLNFTENVFGCICDKFFFQLRHLQQKGAKFATSTIIAKNMCFERKASENRQFSLEQFFQGCSPASYVGSETQQAQNGKMICEHMLLGSDCRCPKKGIQLDLDQNLADSMSFLRINVLIIRDCEKIVVKHRAFQGRRIYWLQFLNIESLFFEPDSLSDFAQLEKLTISRSFITSLEPQSFSLPKSVNKVTIIDTKLGPIRKNAFLGSRVEAFRIDAGDIATFNSHVFAKCSIANLTITNSKIGQLQSQFVNSESVKSLLISGNKIGDIMSHAIPKKFLKEGVFRNNGVFCHCSLSFISYFMSLRPRHVETNVCIAPRAFLNKSFGYAHDFLSLLRKAVSKAPCPSTALAPKSRLRKAEPTRATTTLSPYHSRLRNHATFAAGCKLLIALVAIPVIAFL